MRTYIFLPLLSILTLVSFSCKDSKPDLEVDIVNDNIILPSSDPENKGGWVLNEDLIDEMVITIIPVLLGNGIPLFSELSTAIRFDCKETALFLDSVVQNRFVRKR